MAPYIFIGVFALIGLAVNGFSGLISGAGLGFICALLIGFIGRMVSGGMLPRKTRRDLALSFFIRNSGIVEVTYPQLNKAEILKRIENDIEAVIRQSQRDNPTPLDAWMNQAALMAAGYTLAETATGNRRDLLHALGVHIATS